MQIKVDEIAQRLLSSLDGIDRIVNSQETQEGLAAAAQTLRDARAIVAEKGFYRPLRRAIISGGGPVL